MSVIDPRVSLDDKYVATQGLIYLSGVQALVRLPILQRLRDQAAGLNTAGFISGYRGSPLGGLDKAAWGASKHLTQHHVKFWPAVNEELAATAVWGTQQVDLLGPALYDGVFALWYGKGPGVDRCGDVFKHLNHAGTSRHGGVLLVAGDDHGAYSSTLPHQSDHQFAAAMIPLLYPCDVQEYLTLGLHGWAMSRFSGCAVGFKALADTVESSASVSADPFLVETVVPDYPMPPGGLNARLSNMTLGRQARAQEALMQDYKIYAAMAYARANHLNHIVWDSQPARLGVVASGKSYVDVLEALSELGIDAAQAAHIGLRLFKVSMPWPLEPDSIREFASGLEEIVVVEEKRQMIEYQLKEQLYNWRDDTRPRVIGKFDEQGEWVAPRGKWLLPARGDFSIAQIARVLATRIQRFHQSDSITARLHFLEAKEKALESAFVAPPRPAYYCSGCPHNRSTRTPDGSIALAGIGCHVMATAIFPESNRTMTQMGGEGVTWIGQAPFSTIPHVFANLGDGTYFHSGSLAIRAALTAGVNITYKILYNDAVAMTGGQQVGERPEGHSVVQIAMSMKAEGAAKIVVVTDEPEKYHGVGLVEGVTVRHRDELDATQREFREIKGCTVIIYDQTCATEKRRRRKRGTMVDPAKRVVINELVCEGCGDCGVQSNCLSVEPLETEFGRKRQINQSTCNKDISCVKGFCPSFVTVEGGTFKKKSTPKAGSGVPSPFELGTLPEPVFAASAKPGAIPGAVWGMVVCGVGGTGVITIGQLLGMAAHIEGKGIVTQDAGGLAQKGGATWSYILIGDQQDDIRTTRVAMAAADLVIGCDPIVAVAKETVLRMREGRTHVALNSSSTPTAAFVKNANWQNPSEQCVAEIVELVGAQAVGAFDADAASTKLMGDSIYTNPMMLGYAWQKGWIPLDKASILRAIELNAVAVQQNKTAFEWGCRAAHNLGDVQKLVNPGQVVEFKKRESLDSLVARRVEFLTGYQDAQYASDYKAFVDRVKVSEEKLNQKSTPTSLPLTEAVARYLFKLMAYKDEYEVARLHTDPAFHAKINAMFEGDFKLNYHLAPPMIAKRNAKGELQKSKFGPSTLLVFKLLARLKGLRGGSFDLFGRSSERKVERALIAEYKASIEGVLSALAPSNLAIAAEIARIPELIKGYGHVKERNLAAARTKWRALEGEFNNPAASKRAA